MGKGQKRKNPGVGVDFRRVKHKVGKKLPRAQNETDTSFKSRSINLPDQSVLADKSGAAVTSRNLTLKVRAGGPGRARLGEQAGARCSAQCVPGRSPLQSWAPVRSPKPPRMPQPRQPAPTRPPRHARLLHLLLLLQDLLGQCGHYSDKVRRDAVQGLAELVAAHPQELTRHTTLVMETLAGASAGVAATARGVQRNRACCTCLAAVPGAALAMCPVRCSARRSLLAGPRSLLPCRCCPTCSSPAPPPHAAQSASPMATRQCALRCARRSPPQSCQPWALRRWGPLCLC